MSRRRDSARAARLRERKQKKRELRKRDRQQRRTEVRRDVLPRAASFEGLGRCARPERVENERDDLPSETTPRQITPAILDFCRGLVPDGEPRFLNVTQAAGCETNCCYANVEEQVRRDGGAVQYGWLIWEFPGWYLNSEFHAVWLRDGELVDVTPAKGGERQVLFLPDPHRRWERRAVPGERCALRDHPLVAQYLAALNAVDDLRASAPHSPDGSPRVRLDTWLFHATAIESIYARIRWVAKVQAGYGNRRGRGAALPEPGA